MSTRGAIGIRFNGNDKVAYNHWDSYPTGLGQGLLNWLKGKNIEELECEYESIVVNDDDNDTNCGWQDYGFTSEFCNAVDFLYDSLFCEYAYIINLDSKKLEFYVGFNHDKNAKGRYANCTNPRDLRNGSCYYGVRLDNEFPLNELFEGKWKTDDAKGFVKA